MAESSIVEAIDDVVVLRIGDVTLYLDQHAAYALHRGLGEALAEVALLRWVI